jgi:hypothetical protein
MVERFNDWIEDVLQSHHLNRREDLEQSLTRYVHLDNTQLPQSSLRSRTPFQAMKAWHKLKPEPFGKRPNYLTGGDRQAIPESR